MKKTISLLVLIATLIPSVAFAARVSVSEAQRLASSFVGQNSATMMRGVDSELELAYKSAGDELYVFTAAEGTGYVLVAGDDLMPAILGYSDSGVFRADAIPENMQAWLDEYAAQVRYLQSHPEAKLNASTNIGSKAGNVYPLLGEIKWNQGNPYNLLAPTYSDGTMQCATGCVATAMAQIMRYHKYPEKGTGSYSYTAPVNKDSSDMRTFSVDFSKSTYDWGNMLPAYSGSETDTQKNAVAKLMYDCGVSVNMIYGSSSSAVTQRVITCMAGYFGYDKGARWYKRQAYTLSQWTAMIDAELLAARPVLYSGNTPAGGGHAFVLDGSNASGYYHFNWGWGGSSNGYFVMTDLSPKMQGTGSSEGGYNLKQGIAVGIQPDKGNAMAYSANVESFTCYSDAVDLGEEASFLWQNYYVMQTDNATQMATVGLGAYDASGKLVTELGVNNIIGLKPGNYYTRKSWSVTIPTTLANGTYYIRPNYAPFLSDDYRLMDVHKESSDHFVMVVSGGKATFKTEDEYPSLNTDSLSYSPENPVADKEILVKATISNTGDEYHDNIYAAMCRKDGDKTLDDKTASTSGVKMIVVAKGESTTVEFTMPTPEDAGTYELLLKDNDDNTIPGKHLTVTVGNTVGDHQLDIATALTLPRTVVPKTHLEATASIKNTGDVFSGQIEAMILGANSTSIIKRIYSDFVTIAKGETKQIKFNANFTGGNAGGQYRIVLRNPNPEYAYDNSPWGESVYFTLVDPVSGDVNADGKLDTSDVTALINYILGTAQVPFDNNEADVNADGKIDTSDITALINKILGK